MKRRRFLSLIGAAGAAPLLPASALTTAMPKAAFNTSAWNGAVLHAQSTRFLSAFGLSKALNVPAGQAQALMAEMAKRGVIAPFSPLSVTRPGSRWAVSKVVHPAFARMPRARQNAKNKATQNTNNRTAQPGTATHKQPNIDLMLAHLRKLSFDYFAARAA